MTLKIAVLTPMPSASVSDAVTANAGARRICRSACTTSVPRSASHRGRMREPYHSSAERPVTSGLALC